MGFRFRLANIPNFALKFLLPLIYGFTVMPFTVQFFRRFVSSPTDSGTFLGLIPLGVLHEIFLPFLILALELLSVTLAAMFWATRSRVKNLWLLALVFGFQLFPTFSVYYDARLSQYNKITQGNEQNLVINPAEQEQVRQENELRDRESNAKQRDYEVKMQSWRETKASLEQDIATQQQIISTTNAQTLAALQIANNPGTIVSREASGAQASANRELINKYQRTLESLQQQLAAQVASQPEAPTRLAHVPAPTPKPMRLPYTDDTDYLIKTMGQSDAMLGLLAAAIFPIFVLGAGAVLWKRGAVQAEAATPLTTLNLQRELELCSQLEQSRQANYALQIAGVLVSHLNMLNVYMEDLRANANLIKATQFEEDFLQAAGRLQESVTKADIEPGAKAVLLSALDKMIKSASFNEEATSKSL